MTVRINFYMYYYFLIRFSPSQVVKVVFVEPSYNITEIIGTVEVCLRKDLETAVPLPVQAFTTDDTTTSKNKKYIGTL